MPLDRLFTESSPFGGPSAEMAAPDFFVARILARNAASGCRTAASGRVSVEAGILMNGYIQKI
jgi:hypothetical protein